jgi:DNA-binding NtrC family response regulator
MTGRLLCVTDEPNARQTLFASLQDCGYEVDVATNYRNALALVERSPYDAALLDEEIKQESGIEIFQAIDRSQGAGLDGILCCQNPTVERVHSAISAGMNHVIAKPVSVREVIGLIKEDLHAFPEHAEEGHSSEPGGFDDESKMLKSDTEGECETCGRTTHWLHRTKRAYFCCENCLTRFQTLNDMRT